MVIMQKLEKIVPVWMDLLFILVPEAGMSVKNRQLLTTSAC